MDIDNNNQDYLDTLKYLIEKNVDEDWFTDEDFEEYLFKYRHNGYLLPNYTNLDYQFYEEIEDLLKRMCEPQENNSFGKDTFEDKYENEEEDEYENEEEDKYENEDEDEYEYENEKEDLFEYKKYLLNIKDYEEIESYKKIKRLIYKYIGYKINSWDPKKRIMIKHFNCKNKDQLNECLTEKFIRMYLLDYYIEQYDKYKQLLINKVNNDYMDDYILKYYMY